MKKNFGARGKMSTDEARKTAIGAVRSKYRKMGINPVERTSEDALLVLDDFIHDYSMIGTYAQSFAFYASDRQINLFKKEWEEWRLKQ